MVVGEVKYKLPDKILSLVLVTSKRRDGESKGPGVFAALGGFQPREFNSKFNWIKREWNN